MRGSLGLQLSTKLSRGGRGSGETLGPELITNGDFSVDANWVKGTGVTISGGAAHFTAVGDILDSLYQTGVSPGAGVTLKLVYTILNYSSGSVFPTFGSTIGSPASGAVRSVDGTFTEYLIPAANPTLIFKGTTSPNTFDIDNVSVKQVL